MWFVLTLIDPGLIHEKAQMGEEGFEGARSLFPANFDPKKIQPEFSGKCNTPAILLVIRYICTRVYVVSSLSYVCETPLP